MELKELQHLESELSTKLEELKRLHRQLINIVEREFSEMFPEVADEMKEFLEEAVTKLETCYDDVFALHKEVVAKVLNLMKEKQPFIM
jgi:hypothetical protein